MSLYRIGPSEATSFSHPRLNRRTRACVRLAVTLVLGFLLSPTPALSGFWEGMLTVPQLNERSPADSAKMAWDREDLNLLCVVQIMDGLGRRQAEEINKLKERIEGKATLVLAALDRDESKKWPSKYIGDTWDRLNLTIPVFDLPPAARRGLYWGFDPKPVRILPQALIFNRERALLRIIEGFQTAEALEAALAEVQAANANPELHLTPADSILVNGGLSEWPVGNLLPAGWEIREPSAATFLHAEHPQGRPLGAAEIRRGNSKRRQILFQRLPNPSALLGKKVSLSATARSNCIGRPVVALAMPAIDGGKYRYTPESPFITADGKEIPLRILTACDFEAKTVAWQTMTRETLMPDRGKLFVVVLYLEDTDAPLAAGQFDSISVQIIGK